MGRKKVRSRLGMVDVDQWCSASLEHCTLCDWSASRGSGVGT